MDTVTMKHGVDNCKNGKSQIRKHMATLDGSVGRGASGNSEASKPCLCGGLGSGGFNTLAEQSPTWSSEYNAVRVLSASLNLTTNTRTPDS